MPRKKRFYIAGMPAHVMQRGHNKKTIFFEEKDYREYLKFLKKVADKYECQVHAYVLMTNHVHFLITPSTDKSISLLFQSLGRLYVTYINKTYKRSGTLWEGRHKGNIIDTQTYFLNCMKYIELNPVRANMVRHAADYPWSSYSANALGKTNAILTPHSEYLSLSKNKIERLERYQLLLDSSLQPNVLTDFNKSIQSGTPIGNQSFLDKIENLLKCKVGHMMKGRPRKK